MSALILPPPQLLIETQAAPLEAGAASGGKVRPQLPVKIQTNGPLVLSDEAARYLARRLLEIQQENPCAQP